MRGLICERGEQGAQTGGRSVLAPGPVHLSPNREGPITERDISGMISGNGWTSSYARELSEVPP